MTFVKGKSGNPSGRAKKDPAFEKAIKAAAKGALEQIRLIAQSSEDDGIRLKANTWLLERAHGKTPEEVNVETTGPLIAVVKEG